jgi:hypothetical protein
MVFDGLSNDNEITLNMNDHQSKGKKKYIYNFFFILRFFFIYLEVHCQDCQNNLLSMDSHPLSK